jgi:hypothetical protein
MPPPLIESATLLSGATNAHALKLASLAAGTYTAGAQRI